MNQDEYGWMVQKLAKPGLAIMDTLSPDKVDLLHGTIGVAGEAGELLDAVKKYVIYNKRLDVANIVEELGDLEFYMEMIRRNLLLTRAQCLQANYNKLMKKRYPNGYSDEAAQDRADKAITPEAEVATPAQMVQIMADIKAMQETSASGIGETSFAVPPTPRLAMTEVFYPTNATEVVINGQIFRRID